MDGLVYETTRVIEKNFQRIVYFIVAYRRMIFPNRMRAAEEKETIDVRNIAKMTAITDEEILDEFGVVSEE